MLAQRCLTPCRRTRLIALAVATLLAAGSACEKRPSDATPVGATTAVEHGRYLVTIMACNACHTPLAMGPHGPAPDMSRMLAGHPQSLIMPPPPELPPGPWGWTAAATSTAFAGPWGVTYAPNLTPDPNTGLGIWTEEMFVAAMRTGRHMGTSRQIQPPMPWQAYAQLTDNDLEAIYTYLRSVPPIFNRVPDWQPPKGQ